MATSPGKEGTFGWLPSKPLASLDQPLHVAKAGGELGRKIGDRSKLMEHRAFIT